MPKTVEIGRNISRAFGRGKSGNPNGGGVHVIRREEEALIRRHQRLDRRSIRHGRRQNAPEKNGAYLLTGSDCRPAGTDSGVLETDTTDEKNTWRDACTITQATRPRLHFDTTS